MSTTLWPVGMGFAIMLLVILSVGWLWPSVLPAPPESGERGRRRKESLGKGSFFRGFELLMRTLSMHIASWPLLGLRERAEALVKRSGHMFGMNGDDLIAYSLISATAASIISGVVCGQVFQAPVPGLIIGVVLGTAYPWIKAQEAAKRRMIGVCRGLPGTIDLISLSMEAGLDFPGAIDHVASRLTPDNPLRFELDHLLHKLTLGRSRAEALDELAMRIPAAPMRQFTSSVIQAEKRGTPLAEVLATQAVVMRTQRSQHAEQAAARAAVLILGPLMLIFICVFIIILGPFVIRFLRGELF